jgi:hypothetical protein
MLMTMPELREKRPSDEIRMSLISSLPFCNNRADTLYKRQHTCSSNSRAIVEKPVIYCDFAFDIAISITIVLNLGSMKNQKNTIFHRHFQPVFDSVIT